MSDGVRGYVAPLQPEQVVAEVSGSDLAQPSSPSRGHGYLPRGLAHVPRSTLAMGRFGRLFRRLPPYFPPDEVIEQIAAKMVEPADAQADNNAIPAGYTYYGQFIDHDLTFDPVSSLDRQNDPDALENFRTPRFDLDSVYGSGPADEPFLYDHAKPGRLLVGEHDRLLDLPRNSQQVALVGDPRNDENVLLAHLQLTMLQFHNTLYERLDDFPEAEPRQGEDRFTTTQRFVRWHHQWAAVHDFLLRVVGRETLDSVLVREPVVPGGEPVEQVRLRFFRPRNAPYMPVEFSVAAYRFGHSMIRPSYSLNADVNRPIFTPDPIRDDPMRHLGGFRQLPRGWQIQWRRFLEIDGERPPALQFTRVIDTQLSPPLLDLPPEQAVGISSLPGRNLRRGVRLGLPSGQDVARAMGVRPLTDDELDLPVAGPAPLWYYVLQEAKVRAYGRHLGPVGGRIVAEVFLGVLADDPSSYLHVDPGWTPFLPTASGQPQEFGLPDLVSFTGFGLDPVT